MSCAVLSLGGMTSQQGLLALGLHHPTGNMRRIILFLNISKLLFSSLRLKNGRHLQKGLVLQHAVIYRSSPQLNSSLSFPKFPPNEKNLQRILTSLPLFTLFHVSLPIVTLIHQGLVHRRAPRRCSWTAVLEVTHFSYLLFDCKLLRHVSLTALSHNGSCIIRFLYGGLVLVFAHPDILSPF